MTVLLQHQQQGLSRQTTVAATVASAKQFEKQEYLACLTEEKRYWSNFKNQLQAIVDQHGCCYATYYDYSGNTCLTDYNDSYHKRDRDNDTATYIDEPLGITNLGAVDNTGDEYFVCICNCGDPYKHICYHHYDCCHA